MEIDLKYEHVSPDSASLAAPSTEKTRELMQQGEDYFRVGLYQQAIHVWTRTLFLDRGNPVARAAIERAKRAIAERQRRLDAAVAEAVRLVDNGERQRARHALRWVLTRDPRHSEGRALLERLEGLGRRRERATRARLVPGEPLSPRTQSRRHDPRPAPPRNPASPLKMAVFLFSALCVFAGAGLYLHLNWDFLIHDPLFDRHDLAAQPFGTDRELLPPPALDDLHYFNGARLYAKGRYRDALAELARVGRQSSRAEQARGLILRIEERLLRDGAGVEAADEESTLWAHPKGLDVPAAHTFAETRF